MKRSHESTNQGASDTSKKQRISSPYSDMYSQYSAMNPAAAAMMMGSQYSANMFSQANAASTKSFVNQFNNGMYGAMGSYGGAAAAAAAAAAAQGMLRSPNGMGVSAAGANGNNNTTMPMMSNQGNNSSNNGHEMSRTIYLGNVPKELTSTDILNHVKSGTIESFRMLHEKSCAFISFLDPLSAQMFYQEHSGKSLSINDHELKVGWGRAQSVPDNVQFAAQNGATRNVYLGNLDETVTEESLRSELGKFGEVEHIRVIPEKRIAFVHFTSIYYAVKCVSSLQQDPGWLSRRINYGKDRCSSRGTSASTPGIDQQQQYGFTFQHPFRGSFGFDSYGGANSSSAAMMSQAAAAYGMAGTGAGANNPAASLRTLYLGNIPSEATCEDLCNSIRGGVLFQIRYLTDKHIAFVTFIDANAAMNVFNHACTVGIVVKAKRLRVGWGKPCNIPTSVVVAVQNGGASRNIYIGGIEDDFDEEKLRSDWSEYGEIELINALREKSCVFVNFTHINNAMKALAAMKEHPVYKKYKINYGKDRCGNPPKKFLQATGSQQQGTQYPVISDQ